MLNSILSWLIGVGIFFGGLCFFVHICSKNKYSCKYESLKRKFEIYPSSRDKPQTPKKQRLNKGFGSYSFLLF